MISTAVVKSTEWPPMQAAAEGKGGVRLAEANGTNEDDVGVLCDEGQAEQVLNLRAIDLFWPGPLKVFYRLEDGETGVFDAPFDCAALAQRGLAFDQLGQIRNRRLRPVRAGNAA
jgi:hypothetical protein